MATRNFVISAAHCLFKDQCDSNNKCTVILELGKEDLAIRVGGQHIQHKITGYERFVDIKTIHKHPQYQQKVFEELNEDLDFDICIFELVDMIPLIFTPACLAKPGDGARYDKEPAGKSLLWLSNI